MDNKRKAFLAIFTYSILSGAIAAITKVGLYQIPPLSFAFIRFLITTIIISPFIWNKRKSFMADMKILGPFSLLATVNIIFFTLGIKLTTADISQIIYATVPIVVSFLTYFVFGEKLSSKKVLGISLGFVGAFFVLFLPILEKGGRFSGNLLGNVLLATAVISWSVYMILSKKAQKTHSPFHILSVFIVITAAVLFPFFLVESVSHFGWWAKVSFSAILSMVYIVLVGTISTYLLTQYSIKHGGTVFASMAFYLAPLFGFITAAILLGETIPSLLALAAVFTLLGVFLTTSR